MQNRVPIVFTGANSPLVGDTEISLSEPLANLAVNGTGCLCCERDDITHIILILRLYLSYSVRLVSLKLT